MNKPEWEKLLARLQSIPDSQFSMNQLLACKGRTIGTGFPIPENACGCLYGHVIMANERYVPEYCVNYVSGKLGIEGRSAYVLFGLWAKGKALRKITRMEAIAYVRRVIETGDLDVSLGDACQPS